jgi:hypothetical protein
MTSDRDPKQINPSALTVLDLVRMLAKVGGHGVSEEKVREDLAAGAPTNADGTVNLVHYGAWLVKEMGRGE